MKEREGRREEGEGREGRREGGREEREGDKEGGRRGREDGVQHQALSYSCPHPIAKPMQGAVVGIERE